MLLVFQGVFSLGEPLQDALQSAFDAVRANALDPLLAPAPALVRGLLLDGVWAGVATVAAFVPLIVLFFLFMAVVEDSGYLSRAAFLTDALMAKLGLDGRSFVMMLMGFGCNVPALMGTRIMRSRGLRLLTMLIIPLSLCSARLQVFVFLTAAIFAPRQAPWCIFSLYLMSFAAAIVTAAHVQAAASAATSRSCSSCRRTACRRCARSCCAPGRKCGTSCAARPSSSSAAWSWSGS